MGQQLHSTLGSGWMASERSLSREPKPAPPPAALTPVPLSPAEASTRRSAAVALLEAASKRGVAMAQQQRAERPLEAILEARAVAVVSREIHPF